MITKLFVALIFIIIVLLVVLVLKKLDLNEGFRSNDRLLHTYYKHPTFDLNGQEYTDLIVKQGNYGTGIPKPNALSQWESSSIMNNPKLVKLYSILYNRDCPPPLISQMHKYDYYLPRDNELISQ